MARLTKETPVLDTIIELASPKSWAALSGDGAYRYRLGRRWSDAPGPLDVWVMLNPSTADAEVDDPTIRRCVGFSRGWGAVGLIVVNLFALRSTDPAALLRHPDPIGPENDDEIVLCAATAHHTGARIIAAWGAHPMAAHRAATVQRLIRQQADLLCVGTTKAGAPRHPLYVPGNTEPTRWADR